MLAADVNLQVWLDTLPGTHPSVIIPYVQSAEAGIVRYQLSATKQGSSGSSSIQQSGGVRLQANQPTALTRFSLSVGQQDQCKIELVLFANGNPAGAYQFDCPRTP
ncbi:curli-like amyloid fiber formation chaperone CsgH [Castellaniella sp.]|uniref:curli-like amyloid fiber formation chaperone CsgH n=1 Tax=Castellaniella sp. TaxID=1955812 RepID=UPI002B00352B|nr:curli-like amyloid fiber formation chaperone CsgH [Castellaniella sp.]